MNGTEVSSSTGTNLAYKAHLDVLMGTSKDVKTEKLKDTMLYFDEEVGLADVNQKANGGSFAKSSCLLQQKVVDLSALLFLLTTFNPIDISLLM